MVSGLGRCGYEILSMHVLNQRSPTIRFGMHRDTEENAQQVKVCYTMCMLLSSEGGAFPLHVAGGTECQYKNAGDGFVFASGCFHRTVGLEVEPTDCIKLTVFLGRLGGGQASSLPPAPLRVK